MKGIQIAIKEMKQLLEDGNKSFPSLPYCFAFSVEAMFRAK